MHDSGIIADDIQTSQFAYALLDCVFPILLARGVCLTKHGAAFRLGTGDFLSVLGVDVDDEDSRAFFNEFLYDACTESETTCESEQMPQAQRGGGIPPVTIATLFSRRPGRDMLVQ